MICPTASAIAGKANESELIGASNRFYTLIPHDFGHKMPPIIRDADLLRSKVALVEALLEIESAMSLLNSTIEGSTDDPLEANYRKLQARIVPVLRSDKAWKMVENYVTNTHGATHSQYSLELVDLFDVDRDGESSRFDKFSKLHNRQLLWHGSRTTNFVGILSQGQYVHFM